MTTPRMQQLAVAMKQAQEASIKEIFQGQILFTRHFVRGLNQPTIEAIFPQPEHPEAYLKMTIPMEWVPGPHYVLGHVRVVSVSTTSLFEKILRQELGEYVLVAEGSEEYVFVLAAYQGYMGLERDTNDFLNYLRAQEETASEQAAIAEKEGTNDGMVY